jgi:hypothetical protein
VPLEGCWLQANGVLPATQPELHACDGRAVHSCHLVPKQILKREAKRLEIPKTRLLQDPRLQRRGCRKHHHLLDVARKLRIPRHRLPAETEEAAREYGLTAWLTREYGEPMSEAYR